jgi:hypothetical protein
MSTLAISSPTFECACSRTCCTDSTLPDCVLLRILFEARGERCAWNSCSKPHRSALHGRLVESPANPVVHLDGCRLVRQQTCQAIRPNRTPDGLPTTRNFCRCCSLRLSNPRHTLQKINVKTNSSSKLYIALIVRTLRIWFKKPLSHAHPTAAHPAPFILPSLPLSSFPPSQLLSHWQDARGIQSEAKTETENRPWIQVRFCR